MLTQNSVKTKHETSKFPTRSPDPARNYENRICRAKSTTNTTFVGARSPRPSPWAGKPCPYRILGVNRESSFAVSQFHNFVFSVLFSIFDFRSLIFGSKLSAVLAAAIVLPDETMLL